MAQGAAAVGQPAGGLARFSGCNSASVFWKKRKIRTELKMDPFREQTGCGTGRETCFCVRRGFANARGGGGHSAARGAVS